MQPMIYQNKRTAVHRAFTLIELLVVMAITAILFTLVFKPLIDAFNLTSRAGTQIAAQTAVRDVTRQVRSALSNAVFIFDNANTPVNLWLTDKSGNICLNSAQFGLIDYVSPARQLDQKPGTTPIDPTTGRPNYDTVDFSKSGYALPLAPGQTLGRLFVALADNLSQIDTHTINTGYYGADARQNGMPKKSYANRYSDPRSNSDNRYTLWRAEVATSIADPNNPGKFIPNLKLFHTVDSTGALVNTAAGQLKKDDPNFFYDTSLAGGSEANAGDPARWAVPGWKDLDGDGKVEIYENWRAASSSMLPLDKADMMALSRDDRGNINWDANGFPVFRTLAQFAPGYMEDDPGVPTQLENSGNESPNAIPAAFTSQYTHWSMPFRVFVYRGNTDTDQPMKVVPLNYYTTNGNGRIVKTDQDYAGSTDVGPQLSGANTVVQQTMGPYLDPSLAGQIFLNPDATEFAYSVDPVRGIVNFSFPQSVMIYDPNTKAPLPCFFDPAYINSNPGRTVPNSNNLTTNTRYIDLRQPLLAAVNSGTLRSPLSPNNKWYYTVRITPGSERVYGPDQRPGQGYGKRILYSRISANSSTIGPNEYKINYEDVPNADQADSLAGNPIGTDPRVRRGYIEFCNAAETLVGDDAGVINGTLNESPFNHLYVQGALPTKQVQYDNNGNPTGDVNAAAIEITYNFQMNRPNDIVKIDYLTREMISFNFEARLYDQATGAAQISATSEKIKVRNLQH